MGVQDGGRLGVARVSLDDGRGDGRDAGHGGDAASRAGDARRVDTPPGYGAASGPGPGHRAGYPGPPFGVERLFPPGRGDLIKGDVGWFAPN